MIEGGLFGNIQTLEFYQTVENKFLIYYFHLQGWMEGKLFSISDTLKGCIGSYQSFNDTFFSGGN